MRDASLVEQWPQTPGGRVGGNVGCAGGTLGKGQEAVGEREDLIAQGHDAPPPLGDPIQTAVGPGKLPINGTGGVSIVAQVHRR